MKHSVVVLMVALLALAAGGASAQNTPIGKRIPDIKPNAWIGGVKPSREAQLTCIEFFHPASKRSLGNIDHLMQLSSQFRRKDFQVVVIAAGDRNAVQSALAQYADEGIAVGLDAENECFKALGVTYLPACIVIDDQKKMLWSGDSKALTPQLINNLKQQ